MPPPDAVSSTRRRLQEGEQACNSLVFREGNGQRMAKRFVGVQSNRLRDPFARARRATGYLLGRFRGEVIPMLLRHRDVREAARNWRDFSSNAPCRVPIPDEKDVRSVRQLPIETDPPEHTEYRKLMLPIFLRARGDGMAPEIARVVDELLDAALAADEIEVVRGFSLPLQSRALAHLLALPETEAERFVSWDKSVFRDSQGGSDQEKSMRFDRYIESSLDAASDETGDDFFSYLAHAKVFGRPLTREEMVGYANLTFAAGRDTVMHYVSEALAHCADAPNDFARLRANPELIASASEEFARFFSPLTHIGRVVAAPRRLLGRKIHENERVSLCWASANRDESVFAAPDELQFDRTPNPHVAFGYAAHRCLGAHLARLVMRTLLRRLCDRVARLEVIARTPSIEDHGAVRRRVGYHRLVMNFVSR